MLTNLRARGIDTLPMHDHELIDNITETGTRA